MSAVPFRTLKYARAFSNVSILRARAWRSIISKDHSNAIPNNLRLFWQKFETNKKCKVLNSLNAFSTIPFHEENNILTEDLDFFRSKFFPDRRKTSGLSALFEPKSIAIVGATDRPSSVGRTIVNNLLEGLQNSSPKSNCKIFPVNPNKKTVLGLNCYPSIKAIPEEVDMVVIVTPAKTCTDIMRQCAEKNVKAAVVISAGFKEAGPEGSKLEDELVKIARGAGIRVVGPNCVGVMNPNFGLNATFAAAMGLPGNVAFISQSGAMCTAVLDWSLKEKIGFSAFVSIGSMADVNWGDLIDYLGSDSKTQSILIYMESAGDVASLLSAAKEVVLKKPIVVIKAGKTEAAAQAAASHTGSLAGSYKSFEAAMQRVGIMTTDTIQELFDIGLVLGKQPAPKGPHLMILTNAGGPAVLATDATVGSGAQIAKISSETLQKLNSFLPAAWSHSNPVDILGDASAELYAKSLEVVLDDPNADGVLVVLSPQDVTDPTGTAKALIEARKNLKKQEELRKPILAAWMGGQTVSEGFRLLSEAGIPTFSSPDAAATTFGRLWKQSEAVKTLYGKPEYGSSSSYLIGDNEEKFISSKSKSTSLSVLQKVMLDGRTLLTEAESKRILEAYGIGTVKTVVANSPTEAKAATNTIKSDRYVVKLNSKTLTHKADVGGVKLNLAPEEVEDAFNSIKDSVTSMHGVEHFQGVTVQPMIRLNQGIELILGSTTDPQFGPLMMFGSGGTLVEVFKDTALAVPPLDENLTEFLLRRTHIFKALKGGNGKRFPGVNLPKLKATLIKFSNMIVDLAEYVTESDLNPLLAMKDDFIALDARIVIKNDLCKTKKLSTINAIRPLPRDYVWNVRLPALQNASILVRPCMPMDINEMIHFHQSLTKETFEQRYLHPHHKIEQGALIDHMIPICYQDYNRRICLSALTDRHEIIALCELERPPLNHLNRNIGQIRLVVHDKYQEKGVGKLMLGKILEVAKKEGVLELNSVVAKNNQRYSKFLQQCGWLIADKPNENYQIATKRI